MRAWLATASAKVGGTLVLMLTGTCPDVQAAALFYFMFAEAPHLPLQPPLVLSPTDVYRLQKYTACIAFRYQAAAASAAAPGPATLPAPQQQPATND